MIYYVEDDTNIRDLTLYALRQAGFEAAGFAEASSFFAACEEQPPELVLLDIMLPGTDGLGVLRQVRESAALRSVPVMMLTAKGTEFDKVSGLDAGADDYLAKPFGMMELVSRVNALLRRARASAFATPDGMPREAYEAGPIVLDAEAHVVTVGGSPVTLTPKEFDLLRVLLQNAGRVLTRARLLEDVWDVTYVGETRTVDVHIQTLRQKLAAADAASAVGAALDAGVVAIGAPDAASCSAASPASHRPAADAYIQTVRGVGYCLKSPA